MRRRIVAFLAVLAAAVGVGVSTPTVPTAEAHIITCAKARAVAGHPNADCVIGLHVGDHDHGAHLGFPWRTCWKYVEWHPGDWWTVSHCPW